MRNESKRNPRGWVVMPGTIASTFGEVVLTTISREYGPQRHAAKMLARAAQCSHRTAEKWLSGQSVPTGENLVNLMASSDSLADDINRLVALRRANGGSK